MPRSRALNARAKLESWVHRQWSGKGIIPWLLSPLSFIFLCVTQCRCRDAVPRRLPVPVVVVGNIYVGGTGKTPVTIALAKQMAARGWRPGVISRGYGRREDPPLLISPETTAASSGDEPLLIARKALVPVAVGQDRVEAGRLLLKSHPEVNLIISDDGLQHYGLARDVELCVIGARGLGNEWVLPAGPLREPPSRLDHVDAIILNSTGEVLATRTPRFAAAPSLASCRSLATGETADIDELAERMRGRKTAAAAGIAAPSRFFSMLRAHGFVCSETLELGDHFDYAVNPFKALQADCILITEKDAVKCRQIPEISSDARIWVAQYDITLENYLIELIERKIREHFPRKEEKPHGSQNH